MNKQPKIPESVAGPRLWRAFSHSMSGFRVAWREEAAFRLDIVLAALLSAVCLYLPFDTWLKAVILFSHVQVLVAELLNTAVEAVVDMNTREFHRDAKKSQGYGERCGTDVIDSECRPVGLCALRVDISQFIFSRQG